jgi:hypothetical protein
MDGVLSTDPPVDRADAAGTLETEPFRGKGTGVVDGQQAIEDAGGALDTVERLLAGATDPVWREVAWFAMRAGIALDEAGAGPVWPSTETDPAAELRFALRHLETVPLTSPLHGMVSSARSATRSALALLATSSA